MDFPNNLWYSKEHEWVSAKKGQAEIGVSAFAIDQLGDVVHIDVSNKVGDIIKCGEPFGSIESTKTVSDLYAPLTGKISQINTALIGTPEKIQDAPYKDGWIIKIEVTGDVENLLDANAYQNYLKQSE